MDHDLTTLDVLVDRARTWTTSELQALYRNGRDMPVEDAEFFGWADTEAAAARVLRERIAADWLHRNWCVTEICTRADEHLAGHEQAAQAIVKAFEAGSGLAEAVYRGMDPHGPVSALAVAALSRHGVFHALIGHLVTVVPSEETP